MQGVNRKRLAFEEVERGHATSIVEFKAGSSFRRHEHPLGEEILVIDGVFSDEYGNYPVGSYLRNPEGFAHAPFSKEGCVIFVKLHQFHAEDTHQLNVIVHNEVFTRLSNGLEVLPLHHFQDERTTLVRNPEKENMLLPASWGGEEVYVISGELGDQSGRYTSGCWLRSPDLNNQSITIHGKSLILLKSGHLPVN